MPVRGGERGFGSCEYWDAEAEEWTGRGVKHINLSFTREGETVQVTDEEGRLITDDPRVTIGKKRLDIIPITLHFKGSQKTKAKRSPLSS